MTKGRGRSHSQFHVWPGKAAVDPALSPDALSRSLRELGHDNLDPRPPHPRAAFHPPPRLLQDAGVELGTAGKASLHGRWRESKATGGVRAAFLRPV